MSAISQHGKTDFVLNSGDQNTSLPSNCQPKVENLPPVHSLLSDEEKTFCDYLIDPNKYHQPSQPTSIWWPSFEIDESSKLRNDDIRSFRLAASVTSTENFSGRVMDDFQEEQITGRPAVVHTRINICQFGLDGEPLKNRSALLPPMHFEELSPIDRSIMVACLIVSSQCDEPWELRMGCSLKIHNFEAYKQNVVAGSLVSFDSSKSPFSNWGTSAVTQRIFCPTMDLRAEARAFLKDTSSAEEMTVDEQYHRAKIFMQYLISQKRVLQFATTKGAQQLIAEFINRWVQLKCWLRQHESLTHREDEMNELLCIAVSSQQFRICLSAGFHPSSSIPEDYVSYKGFKIEAPQADSHEMNESESKRNVLIVVHGLPIEKYVEWVSQNNNEEILWDLKHDGWGMGAASTGNKEVFVSQEATKRLRTDGTLRSTLQMPIAMPSLLRSFKTREITSCSSRTNEIFAFLDDAANNEEVSNDPEGLGELVSLALHQDESADYTCFYESHAWIALTFIAEDIFANVAAKDEQDNGFRAGLHQIFNYLSDEESKLHHNRVTKDPGHQAISTSRLADYNGSVSTKQGRQITPPQPSKIYLNRHPKPLFYSIHNGKRCKLTITKQNKITSSARSRRKEAISNLKPSQIQVGVSKVSAAWDIKEEKNGPSHKEFNNVLSGEYGDEAVLWLLSNVFCGRLSVHEDSEVKCYFPRSSLSSSGFRCYTPLNESVASSLSYIWHKGTGSVYWTPFEVGNVFKLEEKKGGMIPVMEMESTIEDTEEMKNVGCIVSRSIG